MSISGPGADIVRELDSDTLDRSLRPVAARSIPLERTADTEHGRVLTNDYWDAVLPWVGADTLFTLTGEDAGPLVVGPISLGRDVHRPIGEQPWVRASEARKDFCLRWSWTVTDPWTVDWIAARAGARVLDPLAGSGWWAALLANRGIDVVATDLHPPDMSGLTTWHQGAEPHFPVQGLDAVESVRRHGAGVGPDSRTLLLAWPPYSDSLGARIVAEYKGGRIIYVGEGDGGCCGDDAMFGLFARDWEITEEHRPVQWSGIHDYVVLLDRK